MRNSLFPLFLSDINIYYLSFTAQPKCNMPAANMFSKFKSGPIVPQNPIDNNPITQHFEIGKQTASAGPELVWRIFEACKKSDGKVSSFNIYVFTFFAPCRLIIIVDCVNTVHHTTGN